LLRDTNLRKLNIEKDRRDTIRNEEEIRTGNPFPLTSEDDEYKNFIINSEQ